MGHEIKDETKAALANWGRFCRSSGMENLGYPKVQPMFREMTQGRRDSTDIRPPAINDEAAAIVETLIRRVCEDPVERCGLWMFWVERLSTWEKIAKAIGEATGKSTSRSAGREATQRAEARIDAALSRWRGFDETNAPERVACVNGLV